MDLESMYYQEKEEKKKLHSVLKKLTEQLHSQAEELARCYVEIVELKDLQEQGLLVRLPIKPGDTAYYSTDESVGEFTIKGVAVQADGFYLYDGDCWDKIGSQYALLTKEEAQEMLERSVVKCQE